MKCPIITNHFPPWPTLQKETALVPHHCICSFGLDPFLLRLVFYLLTLYHCTYYAVRKTSHAIKREAFDTDKYLFLLLWFFLKYCFSDLFPCGSECVCSFCVFIKGGSGNWKESITCNHESCCGMTRFCLYWRQNNTCFFHTLENEGHIIAHIKT